MTSETITPVMQWEMYGPGSTIQFCGVRDAEGYGVRITRDETMLLAAGKASASTLLSYSTRLREHLQRHGYAVKPLAARDTQYPAGPCWGPATPLDASLLSLR